MGCEFSRSIINAYIQAVMKLNLSTLAFGSIIEKGEQIESSPFILLKYIIYAQF